MGNSAHILAYVFNSVSRQHHEVWASQFPFLNSLRNVIPPSGACLYGHITWSLLQAQQQSSMSLSQSFSCKRGGKTRPLTGFHSQCRRDLCQGLVVHLWLRGLTCRVAMRLILVARSLLVAVSQPVLPILGGKGSKGVGTPDVSQSSVSSSSSFAVFRLVCFSNFLINGEALHLTDLCLIWFWVNIFSLGPVLPYSITSGSSMSRQLLLITPLFRRRWMTCLLRE